MATRPSISAVLIDISGTLHVGPNPTPGAVDAFLRLRKSGIPFRLCSNTSKESTEDVTTRLEKLGFDVRRSATGSVAREVWTSIGAVRSTMQRLNVDRPFMILSDSGRREITSAGSDDDSDGAAVPYDSVVIGLCPARLDYAHLNTAFRILAREHPALSEKAPVLIAAHAGRYLESHAGGGGLTLGPGPFVAALEHAVGPGTKATIVGKPSRAFFETVISDMCLEPGSGRIAIIGDDVEADLGAGAIELRLWRVLVRTGKYRPGDEARTISPPDEVVDSFADFIESILHPSS